MAFDGRQSTFVNSLFQTYQHQTGINGGGINGGSVPVPFVSIPGSSHQEQDNVSCIPWSHNTQDDPYELISCIQTPNKNSKPNDTVDCDGEEDLQGLVSNILDEAGSGDSYYSESLPTCNTIWSPKTLREEFLQYFQSEAKMNHNPLFPSNHASREIFTRAQQQSVDKEVEELSQHPGGLATKQWPFNLPDGDSQSFQPQKLPPGLSIPNSVATDPYQSQQSKYVRMSDYNDKGNDRPVSNFPELIDIFRPQDEMNNSCLDAFHADHYIQNNGNSFCNEQYFPEDMNQLISSSHPFMAYENDTMCNGEFPNVHKQTVGMHNEDCMTEQWKMPSPAMSTQSALSMQIPKQLLGDLGSMQKVRNGGVRNQTFKLDAFQDLPDFSPHITDYFQQPKAFSASVTLPNHHTNKITMNRDNSNLMNQYSKHCMQQSQMNKKIKPQLPKEKKRTHMSGFLEGISRRQRTSNHMTETEKLPFSQNPYFSFQGNTQSQRHEENCMAGAGNMQQFRPFMYPMNDLKTASSMPINSNFSSRSTLSQRNGVPVMDMNGLVSADEAAALSAYVSDMRVCRGETYHGMAPALSPSLMMNQGGPVIQLYFYLDECYEQWRCLERERKKTEVILRKTFPGRRTTAVTSTNLPKTPPNPTRTDHLIVNHMREQAKVASLLVRMKCVSGTPLHINIQTALKSHHMAVCIMQARCKDCANMTKHQQQGFNFTEDRDTLLMVMALKDLAATTRRLCSALWCALQMTLPKPVKKQDHHVYEEVTCTDSCSTPFQGYSFWL
ncbi:uncharacterized protein moto [Menidia menidia]